MHQARPAESAEHFSPLDRWATFDCYGTLIDWNGGILRELERLFGVQVAPRLLERYHELECEVQSEAYVSYRQVLTLTLERLASEEGLPIPEGETDALAKALPSWEPFPEVPPALEELRARGWLLAILSNSDRDLIAASRDRIGVPFDRSLVAEDVESYKPAHGHWLAFFERTGAKRPLHVHVAASLFHDVAPAQELGLATVWINRLGEEAGAHEPTRELPDLTKLPDMLEELVPTSRLVAPGSKRS
jgi:2-haloacid dehalogenase